MRFRFRILGITVVGLLTSLWAHGQPVDVEKDFDKRRSSYKLEKFSEEPETFDDSDYVRNIDYLYYLEGKKIVKIRVIESNGNGRNASIKIDDYFFRDGGLRLVRLYFFIGTGRLAAIKNGSVVPLLTGENIELTDRKLVRWVNLGREVAKTDERWSRKEESVLINARLELAKYEQFKNPKR